MSDEVAAAEAALRYNPRPLTSEASASLSRAVVAIAGTEGLALIAHGAGIEAVAVEGLRSDQARVLERLSREAGGHALTDRDGRQAVVMGPIAALAALTARLVEWGIPCEDLGHALSATLMSRHSRPPLRCGERWLSFGASTLIMGVVNTTPDSFSADGVDRDLGQAVALAEQMVAAGADVIDVGGESSRPNSEPLDAATELARVVPAVELLAARLPVPVSVDTRKAEVAEAAIGAGATIVNDIWGLRGDPEMAGVLADHPQVAVVAMHNRRGHAYADLVADLARDLRESLLIAARHGIGTDRVMLDPGFGFGKTPVHNIELLQRLGELRGLGRPLVIGPSRKSTIGLLLGGAPPGLRVEGTLALCVIAAAAGVEMVRVHDVAEVRRGLTVADAVLREVPEAIRTAPAPGPTG